DGGHKLQDLLLVLLVPFQGLEGGADDDGNLVAGEVVVAQQLPDFQLHQFQQLGIIHHVGLVEEDDDIRHAYLPGQQDVLPGLGHGPVGGADHQDGPVHLGGAGDHVLDVVGVAGAVHVGVVPVVGFVLHVGGGDGDAPLPLLRRPVDLIVSPELSTALLGQHQGDGGGQSGLAVVDVTDGAHVYVGFSPFKLLLSHTRDPSPYSARSGLLRHLDGAAHLVNQFLRHLLRYTLVVGQLHAVRTPALGAGPEVRSVSEHLRQGHQGGNGLAAGHRLGAFYTPPACVDITDDIAQILLRRDHLHTHQRLQQHGPGLRSRGFQGLGRCDLKGNLRRVNLVEAAVHQFLQRGHHGVAGQHAASQAFLDAALYGGDEVLGDDAAHDRALEFEGLTPLLGLHVDDHVAVL